REISFGLTWDARLLRVIAADRLISDSSLWVTAHNIDPGSDDCGSAVVHRYDDQATHLEFTDHACPYPIDQPTAYVSIRNYRIMSEPKRPFPADSELSLFTLTFQVIPTAVPGETTIQ